MTVTPEMFRTVMGRFVTGVTVVTTRDELGQPYGVTVNSFTSLSLEPLLILVCLAKRSSGLSCFETEGRFAVNILADDQQHASVFFSSPGTLRSDFPYEPGRSGLPLIRGSLARMECDLVEAFPGGDHKILVGRVLSAECDDADKGPLLYFRGEYARLRG